MWCKKIPFDSLHESFIFSLIIQIIFRCGGARSALQPEDVGVAGVRLLCCRGLVQVITASRCFVRYRYLIVLGSVVDPDPYHNPDLDPNPDPSINKQKKYWFLLFCDFFSNFYLLKLMWMYLQKVISKKSFEENLFFLIIRWRKKQDSDANPDP